MQHSCHKINFKKIDLKTTGYLDKNRKEKIYKRIR